MVAVVGPAQSVGRLLLLFPLKNDTDLVPISLLAARAAF